MFYVLALQLVSAALASAVVMIAIVAISEPKQSFEQNRSEVGGMFLYGAGLGFIGALISVLFLGWWSVLVGAASPFIFFFLINPQDAWEQTEKFIGDAIIGAINLFGRKSI